jgi:hypothetical protein
MCNTCPPSIKRDYVPKRVTMSRAGDTSLVVALPEGRTGASPALFPSAMPRVTRWLTFGAAPGGRAGVSAISPAPATSAHGGGGGQGDASLLERQYNDETNARTHLLRAVMVTVICVAYIVDNITAVHEATLTPIRVVGASAQALCAAALYARPRHGSALFSLAILCLSGSRRGARARDALGARWPVCARGARVGSGGYGGRRW